MLFSQEIITAGKCVFTVEVPPSFGLTMENPPKPHYTYRVKLKKGDPDGKWKNDAYFVGLLTGPDNTRDFTYLGKLIPETGEVRLTSGSKYTDETWPVRIVRKVLARIYANDTDAISAAGWELHHEGRCCRCGRTLTVPESVESGIGPECASKMAA
jgi:hypothetical protein